MKKFTKTRAKLSDKEIVLGGSFDIRFKNKKHENLITEILNEVKQNRIKNTSDKS